MLRRMAAAQALIVLALLTGCYRGQRDDETLKRLAIIEQRLDAQDKAIADARGRADTTELSLLAQQLADVQTKLDDVREALKTAKVPSQRPARREPDKAVTYSVPIGKSPVFGSPKAKVTLVMAMDFDCPYCRRAFDTVDDLRKKYGKELRVVYKPYVVHPKTALLPAQAACAAHKQGKWRELADLIWTKAFDMRSTDSNAFAPERISALAKQAKLDLKRYEQDVAGVCVQEISDEQASMQKVGVAATPSFFINGRYLAGALPIDKFAALIDEEMAKATAAIKGGVKPEQYYDQEIVAKGQPELAP
jgi:protein-disulfide isomerase